MTQGVDTRLEGDTLVVRIPMRFQRRGGRKRIVAPDGSAFVPVTRPRPEGTLAKALAWAHRHGRTGLRASIGRAAAVLAGIRRPHRVDRGRRDA